MKDRVKILPRLHPLSGLLVAGLLWLLPALLPAAFPAGQLSAGETSRTTAGSDKAIVVGMIFEPVSFNPLRGVDSGSYYAATLVYEGLVKYNDDLKLVPALAESFSVSDDGLTYKFTLRKNLRFSTGESLTSRDVKASLALATSEVSPFRSDYADISQVTTTGPEERCIEINLKQRSQPFLSRMAELRILPERVTSLSDHGNKLLSRDPVCTGPYLLRSWETGLELVFERNPHYWGRPAACAKIVWRIIPDRTVTAVALARGEIDVAQVDGRMWRNYLQKKADLSLDQFNGNRTVYLGFNLRHSPCDEPVVRRAMASAINRQTLAKVFYAGYALVAETDTPHASWVYTPTEAVVYDPDQAALLFQKAHFVRDGKSGGSPWMRDGKPLSLRILTVKDLEDVADVVSDDLLRAGVKSEVEVIDYTTLRRLYLQKGRFDAVLWSRSCGPDPESTIVWSSKGPLNFCGLKSEAVDGYLRGGRLAASAEERKSCYQDLQRYLAHELPWVFLTQPQLLIAHKSEIANVQKGQQAKVGLPWDNPVFNAACWQRTK
jgi:peptide/nickel transport system substrate-binding protein